MLAYFEQRYSPRNMVLAAAGNVDFDSLILQAQNYCGRWPMFEAPRQLPAAKPEANSTSFISRWPCSNTSCNSPPRRGRPTTTAMPRGS